MRKAYGMKLFLTVFHPGTNIIIPGIDYLFIQIMRPSLIYIGDLNTVIEAYQYRNDTLVQYVYICFISIGSYIKSCDIKNNAWVTVNNDFLSLVRRFGNDFHEWRHGNECIILFLTRYFISWTHKSAKNYHRALISPLLPRAAFSDRALWRHHNWSVTSCEREILVLWRHICLLSLHAQVGAKAIFTNE